MEINDLIVTLIIHDACFKSSAMVHDHYLTIVNNYCVVTIFFYMQRYDNQVQNMQGRGK